MNNQMMTVMWLDSFRNQRTQMIWKMTMVNHQNHDDDSDDGGAGSDDGGVMRLFGRGFLSAEELRRFWKMMIYRNNYDDDDGGSDGSGGGGVMRLFGRGFLSTEELGLKPCRLPASLENDS